MIASSTPTASPDQTPPRAKILVVEDQVTFASFTERILHEAGYATRWTDASEVALDYLKSGSPDQRPFDLVVLDILALRRVPNGPARFPEGLRLLRQIRTEASLMKIPVIGASIFGARDAKETWIELFHDEGGTAFFEQYYDPEEFLKTVADLLKSKKEGRIDFRVC